MNLANVAVVDRSSRTAMADLCRVGMEMVTGTYYVDSPRIPTALVEQTASDV
jgi:hypothetical protein